MRLSKIIRDDITNRLMRKANDDYATKVGDFERKEMAIADRIYEGLYSDREKELMAELGADFFDSSRRLAMNFTNGEGYTNMVMSESRPFAYRDAGRATVNYDDGHKVYREWRDLRAARKEARQELNRLRNDIAATLNRATTVKKLHGIWPQIGEVINEVVAQHTPNAAYLPAVAVTELNEKLGIGK